MFGDIIQVSDNFLMVEGKIPRAILIEPDIANSLLYKSNNTLYIIDTGATVFFKDRIKKAAERLRPFENVILLNSHGHPDHTPNNSVIKEIKADHSKHYISQKAFPLLDYIDYFTSTYKTISEYYYFLDGPRPPLNTIFGAVKLLKYLNPEWPYFIIKNTLKKFKPFAPGLDTAMAFESLGVKDFLIKNINWSGWNFNGEVYAFEARGHSPDEIVFYFPKVKVLFLADETVETFNCWPDSNSGNIINVIKKSIAMVQQGDVDVLISSHYHAIIRGDDIVPYLTGLLNNYRIFRNELHHILELNSHGLTINQIYSLLRKKKNIPELSNYFEFEFPKMPGFLKTVITCLLLEDGCRCDGPSGKKIFHPLMKSKEIINEK